MTRKKEYVIDTNKKCYDDLSIEEKSEFERFRKDMGIENNEDTEHCIECFERKLEEKIEQYMKTIGWEVTIRDLKITAEN